MNKLVNQSVVVILLSVAAFCPTLADDAPQPVYSYNSQGQIVLATYSNGAAMAYTYDDAGNIATVVQVASPPLPPDDDEN